MGTTMPLSHFLVAAKTIVHRQRDAEGSSVLQAETNRVNEKMQGLKK
jgi:hypothetical protein